MSFDLTPFDLALRAPLPTSYRTVGERRGVLLSLRDHGLTGWGEACPMPGWSTHSLDQVTSQLVVAGARLSTELVDEVLDSLEAVPEARAALAGAVHDLDAQRAGLPLAALLADDAAASVRVNASIGASPLARTVADAELAVAAGFTALKLKVGAGYPSDDVDRVRAVRDAIGDEVELRVDANGAWDAETAIATLDRFAGSGVAFCEEPVAGIAGIAAVGEVAAVPVAVDESVRTVDEVAAALGTGSIDVVVVKPQALGGPDLAMRAIGLARGVGATVVVTSMIDSAIGVAHAVHVAAAAGDEVAHGVATSAMLAHDVAGPLPVEDGRVLVPTLPGLGVSPDRPERY